jgi:hypothetical protein
MRRRSRLFIFSVLVAASPLACAKCAPVRVSTGVARLTVRNTGAIAELINADTACGFESPSVKANPIIDGKPGSAGIVTWTVDHCAIDLDAAPYDAADCNGKHTRATGKLVVSAKRIIRGTITGDPEQPVAPGGPDAVTVEITDATFDRFRVEVSDDDNALTMVSGSIAGEVKPLLAVDAELGACSIPTKNVVFEGLTYTGADLYVQSNRLDFGVFVPTSSIFAFHGVVGEHENELSGTITIWEDQREVPGDDDGLDPEYDRAIHDMSYACVENLALPVRYDCGDVVGEKVAQGVARLTVRNLGAIVEAINEDARCGFASDTVKNNPAPSGPPGGEGHAIWTVTDCTLDFDAAPFVSEDCNGAVTSATGRVTVSATRKVEGLLTGGEDPIVPAGPDAVTIELSEVSFERFAVAATSNPAILTNVSGLLRAKARPRLAVSAERGVCSVPTKHVRFDDVTYDLAEVHLEAEGRSLDISVPRSSLQAVNGKHGDLENHIGGSIVITETEHPIPVPGDDQRLDPDYDATRLESSFLCEEDLALPLSWDCSEAIEPLIAQGAARLTIRNFGVLADRADKDTRCGFASRSVLEAIQLTGEVGGIGSALLTIDGCELDFPAGTVAETLCDGTQRIVSGKVIVGGTKRLEGRLTGNLETPVVPMSDGPAELVLTMRFEDVDVRERDTGLRWKTGAIRGTIHPRTAADASREGACGFETPIARFSDVTYTEPSEVTVRSESGQFDARIDASMLTATNGTWGSESNLLDGTITVDGTPYDLPATAGDAGLDPEFDQATFDARWQCGDVERPVRFDCAFIDPIAQGAAQLSVQMLGTLAKMMEADTACGFSSPTVENAVVLTGELADDGSTGTFTIGAPCRLEHVQPYKVETDCNGKETWVKGTAVVRGTKVLTGFNSGDPAEPIVPTSRDPAIVTVGADLTDFEVYTVPGKNSLRASGALTGTVRPRVAIDTETGACSIPTPVAELAAAWQGASLRVTSEDKIFDVLVSTSDLDAVNGGKDGVTNHLTGHLVMDGVRADIPVAGRSPVLDPDFDQARFDASYACLPNVEVPATEAACNLRETLGKGAARLLVMSMGTVTNRVNGDSSCGFETRSILTSPTQVVGSVGSYGMMSWETYGCQLSSSGSSPYQTDCLGRDTYFGGNMWVDARRTVHGIRDEVVVLIFIRFDSIVPASHDAVAFDVFNVDFDQFYVTEVEPGQTDPQRGLRIRSGSVSGHVEPVLGENASSPGTFDVSTPIAHMTDLLATNLDVRILYRGKRFNVRIDDASIEAFNGSWDQVNMTNFIDGTITVDGQQVMLIGEPLNPDYTQADFDARYECTPNLMSLISP